MFSGISKKFQAIFSSLASSKKINEQNIADAVREIRLALLDADVGYGVAKDFINRVKEKALGEEVLKSVSPKEQFIKIVHDELTLLMGKEERALQIDFHPAVILLCGLQGSGKTTQAAKLAYFLKQQQKKPLLAACDLQRPAAIDQLEKLAAQIEVSLFSMKEEKVPLKVAKGALEKARKEGFDVLIVDTAGRLHLDESLMKELKEIKETIHPHETLFVASAAIGQDAVKTAAAFNEKIEITGTILTMLDGNTRAGAAISIREVTGKPLLFEGIGEKIGDFQPFHPKSMADRILGMGDVINLVRKAKQQFDEKETEQLEKKLKKASFTFSDFLKQMRSLKKMGSFKSLLQMLPGFSQLEGLEPSEGELKKTEAIILSMTPDEREGKCELCPIRRKRIQKGSGTTIDDVNRLIKNFKRMQQFAKQMGGFKGKLFKGGKEEELSLPNSLPEDLFGK